MSISFKNVLLETVYWEPIYWEGVRVSEDELNAFLDDNPFPVMDSPYTLEDFKWDIQKGVGVISLPEGTPLEVKEWVEEAVAEFC